MFSQRTGRRKLADWSRSHSPFACHPSPGAQRQPRIAGLPPSPAMTEPRDPERGQAPTRPHRTSRPNSVTTKPHPLDAPPTRHAEVLIRISTPPAPEIVLASTQPRAAGSPRVRVRSGARSAGRGLNGARRHHGRCLGSSTVIRTLPSVKIRTVPTAPNSFQPFLLLAPPPGFLFEQR